MKDQVAQAGSPEEETGSRQLAAAPCAPPDTKESASDLEEYYSLDEVIKRHYNITATMSTQVRNISFGMLVFVWSILNAAPGSKMAQKTTGLSRLLLVIALLAVITLLTDYLQYVLGKQVIEIARYNKDHQRTQRYKYPTQSLWYRSQYWCFWGKQAFCTLGALLVIVTVFLCFFR